ncbi:MAG: hypothetical protein SOV27_04470 [Eubacteriales bacterium]|nr:hypothetical protein [Eubacteriales bacterium]
MNNKVVRCEVQAFACGYGCVANAKNDDLWLINDELLLNIYKYKYKLVQTLH